MEKAFVAVAEDRPGAAWGARFARAWQGFGCFDEGRYTHRYAVAA
jgi:hypothetical protein